MRRFWLGWGAACVVVIGACGSDLESAGSSSGGKSSGSGGASSSSGGVGGSTSSSGGTTSNGGASVGGTGGGTGDCDTACGTGFKCCDGECINPANDILNCGECGVSCDQDVPFCDNGLCASAPCNPGGEVCNATTFCCGNTCCELDQLCCAVEAGPSMGPGCYDPVEGTCPQGSPGSVCAHPDTPIATPTGDRAIASLEVGDLVYSVVDEAIVAVPIAETNRQAVHDHHVMRIRLEDGSELFISPLHPTADGRTVGDLGVGDALLGPRVTSIARVPYGEPFTHDILPASPSGVYFAAGAIMGSTLAR